MFSGARGRIFHHCKTHSAPCRGCMASPAKGSYYLGKSARQDRVDEEVELDQIAADDFSQVADLSLDINRALNALSFADRDIIALHAWEQLSIPDIAASLGITENNARVKLHRARTRLKEVLEPENLGRS